MTIFTLDHAKLLGHTLDTEPHTTMQVEADEVSDGYHTISELYEHRHALFCTLIKLLDNWITPLNLPYKCWKSQCHSDGSSFDGWFIAGITSTTFTGEEQISYHLPMSWWDKCKCIELPTAPEWDGYTSKDVLERLQKMIGEKI